MSTTRPDFLARPWHRNPEWTDFKVGSVHGLFQAQPGRYVILSLMSDDPGNGDFDSAMRWFYASCKRDKFDLVVAEIMSKRLGAHLLGKRNFLPVFGTRDMKLEHQLIPA